MEGGNISLPQQLYFARGRDQGMGKWSLLLGGSSDLPILDTWNLLSVALPPPLALVYLMGKTGSLSFCPTLSAYHMRNTR